MATRKAPAAMSAEAEQVQATIGGAAVVALVVYAVAGMTGVWVVVGLLVLALAGGVAGDVEVQRDRRAGLAGRVQGARPGGRVQEGPPVAVSFR